MTEETHQVFVVGNSRSGTSMVARALGGHPDVHALRELQFFEELWRPEDAHEVLDGSEACALAETLLHRARRSYHDPRRPGEFADDAARLVAGLRNPVPTDVLRAVMAEEAAREGASIAVEHSPRTVYFVPSALELFPEALVVVVVRDPRDVLVSQKRWWKMSTSGAVERPSTRVRHWAGYSPLSTSLLWRSGIRAGDRTADRRIVRLRFEDLLADPAEVIGRLLSRLGLPWDDAVLDVPRIGSSSALAEGRGVDREATGRWRDGLSRTEVWLCQRLTAAERAAHGYAEHPVRPAPAALLGHAVATPVKAAVALGLNARRSGGAVAALQRRLRA